MVALSLLCAIFSCNRTVQKEMDNLQSVVQNTTVIPPPAGERKIRRTEVTHSTAEPCLPDFDPPATYQNALGNNCPNFCQWVYEGWASTANNTIRVNCTDNPSNWSLTVQSSEAGQYFQFLVFHTPINYADYPHGAGLCSRDLIFEPFPNPDGSIPCIEYLEFEQTGEGDQNGDRAILNLWMSDEYWECYEPGLFNFRVTARMELPLWTS